MNNLLRNKVPHKIPPPIRGFEHVNRYWDKQMNVPAAKILPGEFYVSVHGEMIVTVLGSCVSACIRDVKLGIGGMNHFMLPIQNDGSDNWGRSKASVAARYGNWAMEFLINGILGQGGRREDLEVKVFGGGAVLENMSNVGARNSEFVLDYLAMEGLQAKASDLGDVFPRKVLYFPDTGAAKVMKLRKTRNNTIIERESAYSQRINVEQKDSHGDVDLF